ncbi:hypothetical protein HPB47_007009 [Ixodes persulcatus]|uniref:Uncharacterized protein n=1 Tax=Ixodes persulcatus TaxID=34615 RepID=A0AC60P949_IXOPE|nr:hypothetical protein HPB47_007009 [Ixodes persulcatus]
MRESRLEEKIATLPKKQQLSVLHCFRASQRKTTHGMAYDEEWMLECIMMRMKSPRLYEHIRKHEILILPSRTCIQKYMKAYKSGFGFNPKTFEALSAKTKDMDLFHRHGGLVFDEIKLSEHFHVHTSGKIEGFVDLGAFTPDTEKHQPCDHGLVFLYQPFAQNWSQVVGVFASRGNVKAPLLSKLLLEALICCENAGLFVDYVTCDGATWNRQMWKLFNIKASVEKTTCSAQHPMDAQRRLHFLSDFHHLVKCVRNMFVKTGFDTPEGRATVEHIEAAWNQDGNNITLKAMPHITKVHLHPNAFEKMRVNLAFRLFSDEVLRGLYLYKEQVERKYGTGCTTPTETFLKMIKELIACMTSRTARAALRPGSAKRQFLESFLQYLSRWETMSKQKRGGFLSKSTAEGLRITITSTLSLLNYVTDKVGYRYLRTAILSQDRLENIFGIVRQSSGCNTHPTPTQFLLTVNCLSYYNLAKPPTTGNISAEVISSLLRVEDAPQRRTLQDEIDNSIELGALTEAETALDACAADHNMAQQWSDGRLTYYMAGYAARKCILTSGCTSCRQQLLISKEQAASNDASALTANSDRGGLLYPAPALHKLVDALENIFTECSSKQKLHTDSLMDILALLQNNTITNVGCEEHQGLLTNRIVQFYLLTRLHFYTKSVNKSREERRERMRLAKLGLL